MKTAPARSINEETPILDLRRHRHGEQIRGALYYDPNALLEANPLVLPLPHERTIAICASDERTAEAVSQKLLASGYEDVVLIEDGVDGWKAAGRPTEGETQEQPVPTVGSAGIERES